MDTDESDVDVGTSHGSGEYTVLVKQDQMDFSPNLKVDVSKSTFFQGYTV